MKRQLPSFGGESYEQFMNGIYGETVETSFSKDVK
jgi:hypothetical protein